MKKSKPRPQAQRIIKASLRLVAVIFALTGAALGQASSNSAPGRGASTEDLQKATQNPVASLISVPFQNNVDENIGPYARDRNTLNIQPVIPTQINKNWNLIARVITPLVYQPFVAPGHQDLNAQRHLGTFGLGDIQPTFFLASSKPSKVIWGAGPAVLLPTATDDSLGSGKCALGRRSSHSFNPATSRLVRSPATCGRSSDRPAERT